MSIDTTTASPAATAPAGTPTLVTQAQPTAYQPTTPQPTATPEATAPVATQPTDVKPTATEGDNTAKQQPGVETTPEPTKIADPEFKLPDEYKDKSWAGKVKTQDDLYKQIDNLTSLVGKKAVIPNLKDATAEEREAFYSQLRGKDAAEYPIPAHEAFPTPAETQPLVAKLFMDNGVSPVQAEAIIKGYQDLGAKQLAAQFDPEGMKAAMTTAFGADWKDTTDKVRNSISTMMSTEDAKALDNVPNNILGLVYRTLGNTVQAVNETLKKYGATETFAHLKAPNGQVASTDLNGVRSGLREQLAALSMRPHTAMEQQAIIDQLNKTYEHDPRLQQQA